MGQNLGRLLLGGFRWFDESLRLTLAARGGPTVTRAQSMLFAHLDRDGTRSSELARRLDVSRQAVHQVVRELEQLGLVEQIDDPSNRSAKLVRLTTTGARHVEEALAAFADIEAALADRIGNAAAAAIRAGLHADWGPPVAVPTSRQRPVKPRLA